VWQVCWEVPQVKVNSIAIIVAVILSASWSHAALQSQRSSTEGLKDLADQISASVVKQQKRKIGIIPFSELDGQSTVLGAFVAEELTTKLFTAGAFDIVERQMLNKVMAELKLGNSGVIEASDAKQIGKLAGVDAIVTGTVTDLQSTIAVNCRLIDVQTGRILGAAQTRISKDEDIRSVMAKPINSPVLTDGPGAAGPLVSRPLTSTKSHGFTYELEGCRLSGSSVRCTFFVTNYEEDRQLQLLGAARDQGVLSSFDAFSANIPGTRAIDDDGNDLPLREGQLANFGGFGGMLVRGIRTRLVLNFDGVRPEAKTFSVLDLGFISNGRRGDTFGIQLRQVPLSR
jgi:curli biogenesis system outer membrane secretion channel CsgG